MDRVFLDANIIFSAAYSSNNRLILEIGEAYLSPDIVPLPPNLHDKDKPVLRAAIAMNATHLVTGDITHFESLFGNKTGGVLIQLASEYLNNR